MRINPFAAFVLVLYAVGVVLIVLWLAIVAGHAPAWFPL
jgi:hypothetical protein